MEITGRIIQILPLVSGTSQSSGKEWSKQEYVIETQDRYPRKCCFAVMNDRIQQFNLQQGLDYTISFDIDAHEYNGRYYNSIIAWRAEPAAPQVSTQPSLDQAVAAAAPAPQPAQPAQAPIPESDKLPF